MRMFVIGVAFVFGAMFALAWASAGEWRRW
jgi:hypothetical protein